MDFERISQLFNRIQTYGLLVVLLELLIIGLVIWIILRFLRGTRGARVIKGIGLVLIAATVAIQLLGEEFDFERLNVLYRQFLEVLTLALIIVFQPELRRALMRLGATRLFWEKSDRQEKVVNEVMESIEYLSKNKIGALIALERQVGLGGIVEAGTELDAQVTSELLDTIFWPGSALHDMGVVIRDNRLAAAGVQFPLADSDQVTQEMGSRHRAGLGLSQESDALVIIVSEESGAISLAERGVLKRNISAEKMRAMLLEGLSQSPAADNGVAEPRVEGQPNGEKPAGKAKPEEALAPRVEDGFSDETISGVKVEDTDDEPKDSNRRTA